jgi:hypothetical protein
MQHPFVDLTWNNPKAKSNQFIWNLLEESRERQKWIELEIKSLEKKLESKTC